MGIDIPMYFMAGSLNSIVFKSENSAGMEKITRYIAVRICLFNNSRRGVQNFPLGGYFSQFFCGSVRRGCIKSKLFYSFFLQKNSTSLLETLSNENGGVIWVSQKVGREPNQKGLQTLQKRFKTLELAHYRENHS